MVIWEKRGSNDECGLQNADERHGITTHQSPTHQSPITNHHSPCKELPRMPKIGGAHFGILWKNTLENADRGLRECGSAGHRKSK